MIAIDLGSNTLRGIVYESEQFGLSFERMVKTAEFLKRDGVISEAAIDRVITALKDMDEALNFNAHKVVAKTTAAMRMARNSTEAIASIAKATGVIFEIIHSDDEAFYTQLAVKYRLKHLDIHSDGFVLLDVGGGSTELVVSAKEISSISVNVGIVTMSESFSNKEDLIKNLYQGFKPLEHFMSQQKQLPKVLVSTAGTPTTMASMKQGLTVNTYDANVVNGTLINREDLELQLSRLLDMDEENRALHVGVGRDSLIITGVEILRVLLDVLGFESMLVIDDGLREGIALSED